MTPDHATSDRAAWLRTIQPAGTLQRSAAVREVRLGVAVLAALAVLLLVSAVLWLGELRDDVRQARAAAMEPCR